MANIIVGCAKYMMIILAAVYAFQSFILLSDEDERDSGHGFANQNVIMFLIHFMAFAGMYFKTNENRIMVFYLAQVLVLVITLLLYRKCYPHISRLLLNNMCMLLATGFIIITRLSYNKAVKQCIFTGVAIVFGLAVPALMRKFKELSRFRVIYAVLGILALGAVLILGSDSFGAKLGFLIAGIGFQPSEFVKIIFVFFTASSFCCQTDFPRILGTTLIAAIHVLILVLSRDLGAALIIFTVYLVMLYVSTRKGIYVFAGLGAGCAASIAAYHLFGHVRTRIQAWIDPFAIYENGGYQVSQSLFAIGTGGWFGTGLFRGKADAIPVADEDFVFSAIAEEMGIVFAICLILICVSCYIMFLNIATRLKNRFCKLTALGLGTCYIFQTFLAIGGVTKFIPSTGVTLPLVSYGGSSVVSTVIMFAVIQGLYLIEKEKANEKGKY